MSKYVIIGNSAAAIGAVEAIRSLDKESSLTLITKEPHNTYSRPLISYFLQGKTTLEKMKYRPESFYALNDVKLVHGEAIKVDSLSRTVMLNSGETVPFEMLLVATGSRPFVPPFEGLDSVENKFTFMSLDDALALEKVLDTDKKVLIIGAGLIGLKCAEGIAKRVASVAVVDMAKQVLPATLDTDGAEIVQKHLELNGINFALGTGIKSFFGNTASLDSGETVDFDVLVIATGVRPNTELLQGIADIDKGIIVDKYSKTSAGGIFAAGDCTQTVDISDGNSKIMALLPNAYMQGECAGVNMTGIGEEKACESIPLNAVGFFGLHILTAGNYSGEVYTEHTENNYKKLFTENNKMSGFILIGNVDKAGIYTSLIREQTSLSTIDFELVAKKAGLIALIKRSA
jgi:NAD(P)H-nitrite reductase large subunit